MIPTTADAVLAFFLSAAIALLVVPLLAVPQLTHYVLDGFLWRRRANPRLGRLL